MSDRGRDSDIKSRVYALYGFVGLIFLFFVFYLFSLQIVNSSEYKRRAEEVARRIIPIEAQRGEIYDTNFDVPLVMNIDSFAVDLIPGELDEGNIDRVVTNLSRILDRDPEDIRDKIPENYRSSFQALEVESGVDLDTIIRIAERIEEFPGVSWHRKQIRSYLETGSIAHVLGYVGDITREELQVLYNRGYDQNSVLGKIGIEKQYDMLLRGEEGKIYTTVDVKGRSIRNASREEVPPVPGKNIVLTLDRNIQELCEKALGERTGSIVVVRPHNGEVLAMVSYPWYDPNSFYRQDGGKSFSRLALDPEFPFLNRAIQSNYSPASMFKIVMTTGVIEEEAFPLDKKVVCEGKIFFGDRVFHCHRKSGHGALDLFSGLAESCNVFFWTMGQELGIERIVDYSHRYGLGELTGIDLPGEVKGLVPSPQWKEATYNAHWLGGDTMNISIGQGYLTVTPLQVANLVSMIVNEGVVYKPHVLKEVRDPISGKIIERPEPEVLKTSAIRQETFSMVKEAMRGVITEGTAKVVITTDAVDIAGKTGTGEIGAEDRWSSWFTAYGPYEAENPEDQVVVVVMVEGVNEWEWWAPKAANIVFQGIFADQNYEEAVDALDLWYLNN
jgi:penicillin-binding protein 2